MTTGVLALIECFRLAGTSVSLSPLHVVARADARIALYEVYSMAGFAAARSGSSWPWQKPKTTALIRSS